MRQEGEQPLAAQQSKSFATTRLHPPRVLLAGKLTALDAPGGGEIQMLATARALRAAGIDARLWRPWEERLAGAACLHLFGSVPEHGPLVEAARRQRVPVVLSTVAWFDLASYWRQPRGPLGRLAACARLLARVAWPRLPSWRRWGKGGSWVSCPGPEPAPRGGRGWMASTCCSWISVPCSFLLPPCCPVPGRPCGSGWPGVGGCFSWAMAPGGSRSLG